MYTPDIMNVDRATRKGPAVNGRTIEMPEYHVAYVRKIGPYIQETWDLAFGDLMRWKAPRGYTGTLIGLYWDNPQITPHDKCRIDACICIPPGTHPDGIGVQIISGGLYAVCSFETPLEGFYRSWEEAFEWIVDRGYECRDTPCYEIYRNTPARGTWFYDVCIPLRERN